MPGERTPRVLRIFVSSPRDVGEERKAVRDLLDRELKQDPSFRGKFSFEVVSWDDPAAPVPMTAKLTPQEAVNRFRGNPSDCDIAIVILWSRLGTHLVIDGTPYLSGTEYEYEQAARAKPSPEILVYRRTEKVWLDADDPKFDRKREQRQKVATFFERFRNPDGSFRGGVNEYATPTDFKDLLEKNLREILTERLKVEPVGQLTAVSAPPPVWQDAPYPGLRAFMSIEAPIFFGRSRETDALVAKLRQPDGRFIAVVGASGSGKSSLIYAGLLPRLAEGAIDGSADWLTLVFKPGAFGDNPFLALAAAMKPVLPHASPVEPIAIADTLAKDPNRIATYVDQALAGVPTSTRLVLFCDQAEELLTQATMSQRGPFADLLGEATGHPQVQVVLTMREDFLPQAARYPRLAGLLQTGTFILGVPGPAALADMIRRPAQLAGLAFDEDLAETILKDVGSEPGALPLVAFCLEELYRSSASSHHLTLEAYKNLGRLEGAICSRATEILSPFQKGESVNLESTLSKLFRALVHIDAAGTVSRRRASRDELTTEPQLEKMVMALESGRLLTAEADPPVEGKGDPRAVICLAHEALFWAWPELKLWVNENGYQLQRLNRALSSLGSADPLDRNDGVRVLGELGSTFPEAVLALITAVVDADRTVRKSAIEMLGSIGAPAIEALPVLISTLCGDVDWSLRSCAAQALGKFGPSARKAVPALAKALTDGDRAVRCSAIEALGKIGIVEAQTERALIISIGDPDESVRLATMKTLGELAPSPVGALAVLTSALEDPFGVVREAAAEALGKFGPPAVPALIGALSHGSRGLRWSAARALEGIGSPAVPALITALGHASERVRITAAQTLGRIGPAATEAVPALTAALDDPSSSVRSAAGDALRTIRSSRDVTD